MLLEDGLAFSTWLGKLSDYRWLSIKVITRSQFRKAHSLFIQAQTDGHRAGNLFWQQHFESYICTVHLNLVQFLQCSVVSPLTQHLVSNLSSCLMEAFQGIPSRSSRAFPQSPPLTGLASASVVQRQEQLSDPESPTCRVNICHHATLSKNHMKHMKLRLAKEYPNTPQPREAPKAMAPIPRATFPTLLQALENWPHKQANSKFLGQNFQSNLSTLSHSRHPKSTHLQGVHFFRRLDLSNLSAVTSQQLGTRSHGHIPFRVDSCQRSFHSPKSLPR